MMTTTGQEKIIIDRPAEYVAQIIINRPEAKNAVDEETRLSLISALKETLDDEDTRAILLSGAEGVFCAGGDLASMRGLSPDEADARMKSGHELVNLLWQANVPVVVAIEKFAIGAGAGLALVCDYLVAGRKAKMAFPFLQFGLVPDWGSTQSLIRRAGWGAAKKIILEKASLKGPELLDRGIVDMLAEDDKVLSEATQKAIEFSHYPQLAFRKFKARMNAYPEIFETSLGAERRDQAACFLSAEFEEGLDAFMEKRSPDFISAAKRKK